MILSAAAKQKAKDFLDCERGVAYIEFAISLGVLLIMFFGAIEVTRYILIVQKLEKTVDTLTDVMTQSATGDVTSATITQYLNATQSLMSPYNFGSNGLVILSDISTPTNSASPITINWQICGSQPTLQVKSALGSQGGTVDPTKLPGNFAMGANEEVVIGEIFYNYTPILSQNIVSGAQVYRAALFKPRFATFSGDTALTQAASNCP